MEPEEPPETPACDPGKLRLFEDAVDWQPRTGTSQSRSFRKLARLTGTDGRKFLRALVPRAVPGCGAQCQGLAMVAPWWPCVGTWWCLGAGLGAAGRGLSLIHI